MTIFLLAVLGLVWCCPFYVIAKALAGMVKSRKWAGVIWGVAAFFAFGPLLAEYYTYYNFRKYCTVNAGMGTNKPVVADRLLVDGWYEFTVDVFKARAIETVA